MVMTLVNSWYRRSLSLEANTGNRVMLSELIVLHADSVCKIIGAPHIKGSVVGVARCRVHRPYSWRQLTATAGLISSLRFHI